MENPIALIEAHKKRVDKINEAIEIGPNGTSLTLLQAVYRSPVIPLPIRMRAAMACLPMEHPRLAVTAVVTEQDFATLLDQRIAKLQAMEQQTKTIEAAPIKENGGNADARLAPSIPDRRFRRI